MSHEQIGEQMDPVLQRDAEQAHLIDEFTAGACGRQFGVVEVSGGADSAVIFGISVSELIGANDNGSARERDAFLDLVATLWRTDDVDYELRYICTPRASLPASGRVKASLIVRRKTDRAAGDNRPDMLIAEIWSLLTTLCPAYVFEPLGIEDLKYVLRPFPPRHMVEVGRREAIFHLDSLESETHRTLGLSSQGRTVQGPDVHGLRAGVYHTFPFVPRGSDLARVFQSMLMLQAPSGLRITLKPTCLTQLEMASLEAQIVWCETCLQTGLAGGGGRLEELRPTLRYQAGALRAALTAQLLTLRDAPFELRLALVSETAIPQSLIDVLGVEVTEVAGHRSSAKHERMDFDQSLGGGYDYFDLSSSDGSLTRELWIENLPDAPTVAPAALRRLRCLVDPIEAAAAFRLPSPTSELFPGFTVRLARTLAAPPDLPSGGLRLGTNTHLGFKCEVTISEADRTRHAYIVGQTGTGKSTLLESLIMQDIENGEGVAVVDPHGDLVQAVLEQIPPGRESDVIVFDASLTDRPLGLNLLEARTDEQMHFVASEIIGLLYKLYDPDRTGIVGPRFEHAVRNALLTIMAEPGNTLVELVRVLTDREFLNEKLEHVTDPVVRSYWIDQIAQTSDFHKSEVLDYIVSKFGRFVTNRLVRNIIGQSESSFDFRQLMDAGKILLVNLSKGEIGPENSSFLGLVLMPKLFQAALTRSQIPQSERKLFHVYVDEFQNLATTTFSEMFAEARKYGVTLTVANQHFAQLERSVQQAVIGNIGTVIAFRTGAADSALLQGVFQPSALTERDFSKLPNYQAFVRMQVRNEGAAAFSLETAGPRTGRQPGTAERVIAESLHRYGRDRAEVERSIITRAGYGNAEGS